LLCIARHDHSVGLRHQAIDVGDRFCRLRVGRNLPITEVVSCHDVKVGYLRDDHFVWRAPEPVGYLIALGLDGDRFDQAV
jgi:hypothetical protein